MRDLREMDKLEAYLIEHGIRYERIDEEDTLPEDMRPDMRKISEELKREYEPFDKHQIIAIENDEIIWDVICHRGSYGADEGLLEGYGKIFNQAEGHLTAEDVNRRIAAND